MHVSRHSSQLLHCLRHCRCTDDVTPSHAALALLCLSQELLYDKQVRRSTAQQLLTTDQYQPAELQIQLPSTHSRDAWQPSAAALSQLGMDALQVQCCSLCVLSPHTADCAAMAVLRLHRSYLRMATAGRLRCVAQMLLF